MWNKGRCIEIEDRHDYTGKYREKCVCVCVWDIFLTDVNRSTSIPCLCHFASLLILHWYCDNKKLARQGIKVLVCISRARRRVMIDSWNQYLFKGCLDRLLSYIFIPVSSCYASLWIVTFWFGFILLFSLSLQLNKDDSQRFVRTLAMLCFVLFVSCGDDSHRILNGIISCT